jgi:hypothetical protein
MDNNNNSMELNNHNDSSSPNLWLLCVLLNLFGHFLSEVEHAHIPEIVMQFFQIAAWCGAIGIFFIQLKRRNKEEK